jgi:hypothetical protein
MSSLRLLFLVFGFVCFVLSALLAGYPAPRSQQLQAAGLAFWIATLFLV